MKILLIIILLIRYIINDNLLDNNEFLCDEEGIIICQVYCSPSSQKSCKQNKSKKNKDYCCTCEFYNGEFKSQCIKVIDNNIDN